MPHKAEVYRALWGALRLARFDKTGISAFGNDGAAALRSFFAAALVAPMHLTWLWLFGFGAPENASVPSLVGIEFFSYIGGWLIFPVLFWHMAPSLDCRANYARFICTYNWTSVVQNAIFLFVSLILFALGAGDSARSFIGLIALLYILVYAWFAARTALDIAGRSAAIIVVADFILTLVWEGFTDRLAF